MEKQRNKPGTKSCRRLLAGILVCFLSTVQLYALKVTPLKLAPSSDQDLYTETEIKFELVVPDVKPSHIQLIASSQSSGVTLKSMRKTEDYDNNGTLIEAWFIFDKTGTYKSSPLQATINGRKQDLVFDSITITEDPAKKTPRIVIQFNSNTKVYSDNGQYSGPVLSAPAGEKLNFTVYLQYANHLINFNWDIPKDAIFSQTKTYDIMEVKYREKKVSHDLEPVASFQWTSLTKGVKTLPKMKLTATGFNGLRYELIMPEISIDFTEGSNFTVTTTEDKMFDSAFSLENSEIDVKTSAPITKEVCQTLAALYSKERNSIFNQKMVHQMRVQYELENNLPSYYEKDFSIRYLIGAILIFAGGFILFLISMHKRNPFRVTVSIIICLCALIPGIYSIVKLTETQGICTGCTVYSIPEETAEAKAEMGAGNKVKITEKTDKWYYIELGETGGWCHTQDIILIK